MSPALRVALSIAVIWLAVEAGLVLEERAIELHRDVARQQVGEDFLLVGLIFDRGGGAGLGGLRLRPAPHRDRDDLVDRRLLHESRAEVGISEVDDVDAVGRVAVDEILRDGLGVGIGGAFIWLVSYWAMMPSDRSRWITGRPLRPTM